MYIVLEGVVGVGKTTQSKLLQQYLQNKYPDKEVLLVREPGGTIIAENIRKTVNGTDDGDEIMHPLTDAFLFVAARIQLLNTIVKPALDRGAVVISDRSFVSSLVYQGYCQGLGMSTVREINQHAIKDCLPDMILFFDLSVEIGYTRTFDVHGDKWEKKPISFFKQAHEGFEQLFLFDPLKDRIRRINVSGTLEEVFETIKTNVDTIFEASLKDSSEKSEALGRL